MKERWQLACVDCGSQSLTHRNRKGGWYCQTCETHNFEARDLKRDALEFDYPSESKYKSSASFDSWPGQSEVATDD